MLIHPRSVADKVFDVWRSPGRFTKNPDLIQLPSGRLMLVYSDTHQHWAQESEVLTLLASDDLGRTWSKFREVAMADQRRGEGHQVTGITGFEPDRILDLPDGVLGVGSQAMLGDTQEFAEILSVSRDGGQSWQQRAIMAHDGYHRFCEGAVAVLNGGKELACVMRENHSAGIPCLVTFSQDDGYTWSAPQYLPFALHRPYAKQLADGRVLVNGRNVNGGLGTWPFFNSSSPGTTF